MSENCIERVVSGSVTNYGERLHSENHHEWVLIVEEWKPGSFSPQVIQSGWQRRFYCKFCREVVEE